MNYPDVAIKKGCDGGGWRGCVIVLLLAGMAEAVNAEAGTNPAVILETKVICREPGKYLSTGSDVVVDGNGHPVAEKGKVEANRYVGWPTITQTKTGELIVVYSGDRDAHVCPWGKTQIIRSQDLGKTWSEPVTITSTPLDDRDAGIIQSHAGTLVVSWFTSLAFTEAAYGGAVQRYVRHAEKITPEIRKQWLGNWIRRSEDGGVTWQEPIRTVSSAPHGPIVLRNGKLLYVGTGQWQEQRTSTVEESSDDGRSWEVMATIPFVSGTPDIRLEEPHVVELASGKLLAMFRYEPRDRSQCFLQQAESEDGGRTWTAVHSSGIWGYPPHLIQLSNGWVLAVYGYRREPYGQRGCLSRDEGRSWDLEHEIILADTAPNPDLGYPSSVQLADGSILTVYYQVEKPGEMTCLMSTHWRLKEP